MVPSRHEFSVSILLVVSLAQGACGQDQGSAGSAGSTGASTGTPGAMRARPAKRPTQPHPKVRRPPPARPTAALSSPGLFRGGSGRLGSFGGPGPRARQLHARYSVRLDQKVHVSAVSDGETVFAVSARGLVLAARVADGRILWSRSTRAGVAVAPGLGPSGLYIGDRTGRVWCLHARTGAVRWQRRVTGAIRTAPLPQAGRVVVGTRAGRLLALDATTGAVRWELKQQRPFAGVAGSPAGLELAVTSMDRRVRLLEAKTGQQRWSTTLASSSRVAPVLTRGAVFVLSASGTLIRLERRTGRQVWTQSGLGYKSLPPAVAQGLVFVASRKRLLYALDARTGQRRWVKPLSNLPSGPPVFARDTVFLATRGPHLLAIRADSGGHYVRHPLPSRVLAEPLPLGNALLLVDQRGIATLYTKK